MQGEHWWSRVSSRRVLIGDCRNHVPVRQSRAKRIIFRIAFAREIDNNNNKYFPGAR
ncbi:predicted protein [Botrytis cinerea T4]|uniref:Uncharacterized protein n=1 Tax=Botryotinia fuckeliana (strain T4) TaxID=999810 RepID=G2YM75_BOTF4|nr:predicted protein [Botrytis cinerea T4]